MSKKLNYYIRIKNLQIVSNFKEQNNSLDFLGFGFLRHTLLISSTWNLHFVWASNIVTISESWTKHLQNPPWPLDYSFVAIVRNFKQLKPPAQAKQPHRCSLTTSVGSLAAQNRLDLCWFNFSFRPRLFRWNWILF
jgi:hypothetical protein